MLQFKVSRFHAKGVTGSASRWLKRLSVISTVTFLAVALLSSGLWFIGVQPAAAVAVRETELRPQDLKPLDTAKQTPTTPQTPKGDFRTNVVPGADEAESNQDDQRVQIVSTEERNRSRGTLVDQTELADVYRLPNGLMRAEQHAYPINDQDESGRWSKIDKTLKGGALARKTADLGGFASSFAARLNETDTVSYSSESSTLGMTLRGVDRNVVGQSKDSTITYKDALPGADLTYNTYTSHVEELITVRARPSVSPVYVYDVRVDDLTPVVQETGAIVFERDGEGVFTIPVGRAVDAKGVSSLVKLEYANGILMSTPDPAWMMAADRAYPVVVDPDVWATRWTNGGLDVQLASFNANGQYNGASQTHNNAKVNRVGYENGHEYKAVMKFDLSPFVGKDVVGATLETYTYETGDDNCASVLPIAQSWNETSVTWNTIPNHFGESQRQWFHGEPNKWSRINVTDWMENELETGDWGVNGFYFDTVGDDDCYLRMAAAEQYFLNHDPNMNILYHDKASASSVVSPINGARLQTLTPTLSATPASAADGGQVKYFFRVSDSDNPEIGSLLSSGWQDSPSWQVPSGSLKDGVTYSWYVQTGTLTNTTPTPQNPDGYPYLEPFNGFMVNALSNTGKFKIDLRLGDQTASPDDTYGPVTVNLTNGNVYTSTGSPEFSTVGGNNGLSYSYNSQAPDIFGLTGKYYPGCIAPSYQPQTAPYLVRTDSVIDFSWQNEAPAPGITPDNFCDFHTGVITPPVSGSYCFDAISDDGVRLRVGNSQLIDRWTTGTSSYYNFPANQCVQINGQASISIDHFDATGGSHLKLYVKDPNGHTFVVPSTWLTPGPRTMPRGWALSVDADQSLSYVKAAATTNSVVLTNSAGKTVEFKRTDPSNANAGFTPPVDDRSVLSTQPDGSYRLSGEDGLLYAFDQAGNLLWVQSALDDRKPAAARYEYATGDGVARLSEIIDPVSSRKHVLTYGNGANCAGPSGFDGQAPAGMLCKVRYWDNTETHFAYLNGQLARILDPGNEVTLFGYDGVGKMTSVRDNLQNDWVAANLAGTTTGGAQTNIKYNGDRAQAVVLASPNGAETNVNTVSGEGAISGRPFHRYEYGANESFVYVNGINPNNGGDWDRKVTFNANAQTLTETGTDRVTTENEWDPADRLLRTKNLGTGRQSTTFYDEKGNVTDAYGPAPAGCFGADRRPLTQWCQVAHTKTNYDEGITGLAVTWWANADMSGSPKRHSSSIREDGGTHFVNYWENDMPHYVGQTNQFSFRATGSIHMPTAGAHVMRLDVDDNARLWIDDRLIIDNFGGSIGTHTGTYLNSTPGWHRIRIEYRELTADATFVLGWTRPGMSYAWVQGNELRPDYSLATSSVVTDNTAGSPTKTTQTKYNETGWDPVYGLATSTTEDPNGLALKTSTSYENPATTELDQRYLRPKSRTLPAGNSYTSEYYLAGQTAPTGCLTNATGAVQNGYLKAKTYPLASGQTSSRVDNFAYDIRGRIACSWTNSDAKTVTSYDARGRVTSTVMPVESTSTVTRTVTNSYQLNGNPLITRVSDVSGTIATEVDLLGRTIKYTDAVGRNTLYGYDTAGRQTTLSTWSHFETTNYGGDGRVVSQVQGSTATNGKPVAVPSYSAAGEVTSVSYPDGATNNSNGTSVDITYDDTGKTNSLTYKKGAVVLASDAVTYSQSGEVVDQSIDGVDANPAGPNFSYDAVGRLIDAWSPGHHYAYSFAAPSAAQCGPVPGWSANAHKNTNRTSWADNGITVAVNCHDNADRLLTTTDARYGNITYDDHGNTLTMGDQVMTYDLSDRHLSTTANGETVTYVRDALDRIIKRTHGAVVTRYSYNGNSDNVDFVLNNSTTVLDKTMSLIGGVTKTVHFENSVYTDKFSYPNIHGDTLLTANKQGVKEGSTRTYDPFGQALTAIADNLTGDMDMGWLGSKDRPTEHFGSVETIEMGARQYVAGLGRFLEVDPVEGGSANDYDYVSGRPLVMFDRDGRCMKAGKHWLPCAGQVSYKAPKDTRGVPKKIRGTSSWIDADENKWTWDKKHKDHWDVEDPRGNHINVSQSGKILTRNSPRAGGGGKAGSAQKGKGRGGLKVKPLGNPLLPFSGWHLA